MTWTDLKTSAQSFHCLLTPHNIGGKGKGSVVLTWRGWEMGSLALEGALRGCAHMDGWSTGDIEAAGTWLVASLRSRPQLHLWASLQSLLIVTYWQRNSSRCPPFAGAAAFLTPSPPAHSGLLALPLEFVSWASRTYVLIDTPWAYFSGPVTPHPEGLLGSQEEKKGHSPIKHHRG